MSGRSPRAPVAERAATPPPPTARHRRGAEVGGVLALAVAVALAVVRPGWSSMAEDLPANTGDPALIVWILSWGVRAATTDPLGYFDGPIFWPHPDTLAYSDTLLPVVPIYGVAHLLTGGWASALHLTLVALVVGNVAATYALARWLTGRRSAAAVAAVAFGSSGYVAAHWGHVQLWTLGTLPLAFLLLFVVLEGRRTSVAVALGVANAAVVLGAAYYGAIWAVCAAVVVAGHLVATRLRPGPGFVRCMAVTVAVTSAIVVPTTAPYVSLQRDDHFRRPLGDIGGLALDDFLVPAAGTPVWDGLAAWRDPGDTEHRFWPGASVALLAVAGAVVQARGSGARRPRLDGGPAARAPVVRPDRRRYVVLLVAAGVAALVLALGPTVLGVPAPFRFFFHHVPGFPGIRVPARFAVVTLLAVAVLASVGVAALTARVRAAGRRAAIAAALCVVAAVDLAAEHPTARLPDGEPLLAVYEALDRRPEGPVVELPMAHPLVPDDAHPYLEAPRMVYATIDWNPRVNGYSGFTPEGYVDTVEVLNTFPSPDALAHAAALDVRYVILHVGDGEGLPALSEEEAAAIVRDLPAGASAERHGAAWLVDLEATG